MSYLDSSSNIRFFYRDPAEKIARALIDFCHKHGIPGKQTDDAVNLALACRDRGSSVAVAVEHGKNHVRLWLAMNQTSPGAA
jgi:hypothetical protein